jgi:peptidoglycan/xylan/chitin deacetylase (PgdA/CDA1 family)
MSLMRAILTYHSLDASGSPISLSVETFVRHVSWLASGRVSVEPLAAVVTGNETTADGRHRVALTFDDAFANFATEAWPRLREAGLPATLFVVTGHVGRTNRWGGRPAPGIPELPLMSWAALGACAEAGVEVAAHSRSHPRLTTLAEAALDEELAGSRDDLATHLGVGTTSFAYPYGDVDDRVAGAAARVFTRACTTEYRALGPRDGGTRLPRLDMFYFQRPEAFADWGTPAFTRRVVLRRAMRTARAWWTAGSVQPGAAAREARLL